MPSSELMAEIRVHTESYPKQCLGAHGLRICPKKAHPSLFSSTTSSLSVKVLPLLACEIFCRCSSDSGLRCNKGQKSGVERAVYGYPFGKKCVKGIAAPPRHQSQAQLRAPRSPFFSLQGIFSA